MITIRHSNERGHADHGWLNARHSFSFGNYVDHDHMGFASLRVINEDRIAPGMGFGTHPHRDMEIITYIIEGALEHKDSTGNGSVIRPGDIQVMSAGSGIRHSEFNASPSEPVHLLQIWIETATLGIAPHYDESNIDPQETLNTLRLIVSGDGRDKSLKIHQDVDIYNTRLEAGQSVSQTLRPDRKSWVQMVKGNVTVNNTQLSSGDGAAIENDAHLVLTATEDSEFILFDLNP